MCRHNNKKSTNSILSQYKLKVTRYKNIMSNIPGKVPISSQEIKSTMPPPSSSNNTDASATRKSTIIHPSTAPRTSIQTSKKVVAVTPEYEISTDATKKNKSIRPNTATAKRTRAKGNSVNNEKGKSCHLV